MANALFRKTNEEYEMLEILLTKCEESLNEWEHEFLTSIGKRDALTFGQRDKLHVIWEEIMDEGFSRIERMEVDSLD